jgi:hypothetical protein
MKRCMRGILIFPVTLALLQTGCGHRGTPVAELINGRASLPGGLPDDPLKWRVITSGADPGKATMFTLFGNDAAVDHARGGARGDYPAGAVLALVTWRQQEDPHWYGAKIPGEVVSVEFARFGPVMGMQPGQPAYERYEGNPLKKVAGSEESGTSNIVGMTASVMP